MHSSTCSKQEDLYLYLQQSDKNIYQLQLGSLLFHKNTQNILKMKGGKHLDLLRLDYGE